ncbi:hypothetical protein [Methylobacterium crusticola]|nr:hypothetical protein [Methylobacterium crusticola]
MRLAGRGATTVMEPFRYGVPEMVAAAEAMGLRCPCGALHRQHGRRSRG